MCPNARKVDMDRIGSPSFDETRKALVGDDGNKCQW